MLPPSSDPNLVGVLNFIQPSKNAPTEYQPATGEVEDDMEGEQETIPDSGLDGDAEIQPFVLREFPPAMAHLCPVRAYSDWVKATKINEGYVFRKLGAGDRPSSDLNAAMTSEHFLEMFRNNLIDIHIDPAPYGTHSFRRGGCQWMSVDLRWPLRDICEWGGWSTEFTHLTIVKYLISWNDSPSQGREDFFNFKRAPVLKCWSCGRSCRCA